MLAFFSILFNFLKVSISLPVTPLVVLLCIFREVEQPELLLLFCFTCTICTTAFSEHIICSFATKMAKDALKNLEEIKKNFDLKQYLLTDYILDKTIVKDHELNGIIIYTALPKEEKQKELNEFRAYPFPKSYQSPILCGVEPNLAGPLDIFHLLHEVGHIRQTGYFHNLNAHKTFNRQYLYYMPLIAFLPELWFVLLVSIAIFLQTKIESSKDYSEVSADQFSLDIVKKLFEPIEVQHLVSQRIRDLKKSLSEVKTNSTKEKIHEYTSRIDGFGKFARSENFIIEKSLDLQHIEILNKIKPIMIIMTLIAFFFGNTIAVFNMGVVPMLIFMWCSLFAYTYSNRQMTKFTKEAQDQFDYLSDLPLNL